jgi:hypothetical protein
VSSAIYSTCDAGVVKAAECRSQPRHPKLVLATTILASSLAFIDGKPTVATVPNAIGKVECAPAGNQAAAPTRLQITRNYSARLQD